MARRKDGPILAEILAALDGIEKATSDKTLHDYEQDWLLKHGVQRGIEIISEAARHLPDELLVTEPEIPWKQMRGIGNVPRHEYHRIADPIVWAVVTRQPAGTAQGDRTHRH
ncbi:HepT-like ribonuclease domain-containing protein [Aminobacter sp. BE82]|uniref:HepT-like ribonuclease domain-containing protein n=1 Tax=Aminobacter sp. BE82 TaxID=2817838 RepID=UPI003D1DF45A